MNKFYMLFFSSANKCCFDPFFLYKAKGWFLVLITITPNCYDENSLPNYHTSFPLKKKILWPLGGGCLLISIFFYNSIELIYLKRVGLF